MENGYTIGALARSAGVPVSTVRFYERRGILRPESRSQANYRRYSQVSLEKLRLIRASKHLGLSLKDVRELLGVIDSPQCPCREIEMVVKRRLSDVQQRLKDLRRIERTLARALRACACDDKPGFCKALCRLRTELKLPVEICGTRP